MYIFLINKRIEITTQRIGTVYTYTYLYGMCKQAWKVVSPHLQMYVHWFYIKHLSFPSLGCHKSTRVSIFAIHGNTATSTPTSNFFFLLTVKHLNWKYSTFNKMYVSMLHSTAAIDTTEYYTFSNIIIGNSNILTHICSFTLKLSF